MNIILFRACLLLSSFALIAGKPGQQASASFAFRNLGAPYLRNFTPKEYGSHSQNWAVVQDKRGVIYVANNEGVLECDGIRWRLIPTIKKTVVRSLAMDETGRIFVGAVGEIGYLAPDAKGQMGFVSLHERLGQADRVFSDVWRTFATPQGVFFQSDEQIVLYAQGHFQVWKANQPFHISFCVNGHFYVRQTDVGFLELREGKLQLLPGGERFAQEKIYVVLPWEPSQPVPSGRILVGTRTQGLFLYDGQAFTPFPTEADAFLKANLLYCGGVLGDGTLAFGTSLGGVVLLERDGKLRSIWNKTIGLQDASVRALTPDAQGGLWLALNQGVSRLEWPSALTRFEASSGLEGAVYALQSYRGRIYVGTALGGFVLTETPAGPRFQPVMGIKGQSWGFLSLGERLLVANISGLFEIWGEQVRLIRPSEAATFALLPSRHEPARIFLGLQTGLASVLRASGDTWTNEGKIAGIPEQARTLVEAGDGSLWLGTRTQGVLRVRFSKEWKGAFSSPTPRVERFDTRHGLPSQNHCHVHLVGGSPTFVTHGGILRFDEARGRFEPDPRFTGLFKEGPMWVLALFEDHRGRVWMTAVNEASRIRHIGVTSRQADGTYAWEPGPFLRFGETTLESLWVNEDGVAWFGGPDGLIRYDPSQFKTRDKPTATLVRRVATRDGSVLFGGAVIQGASVLPELKYVDNTLRFEFAAPSFDGAEANRYQVLMDGLDRDWSTWSPEAFKEYTHLAEGRYTFRVRARDVYGVVTREGRFAFRILPPWYRTWWAYLMYLVSSGSGLWTLVRWRLSTLRRRNEELEQKVHERTAQLEERSHQLELSEQRAIEATLAKSRFLASMSHELRTPLNAILGFAQLMRRTPNRNKEDKDHLDRIHRAGEHLLGLINDVLSISKIEAGKLTLNTASFPLRGMIQGVAEMIGVRTQEKGLDLVVQISPSVPDTVEGDEGKLRQVLINLLGNAVKFTEKGEIALRINQVDSCTAFEVRDTGAGMSAEETKLLFTAFAQTETGKKAKEGTGLGLHISQVMVKLMGGKIEVESELGKGSVFRFTIPLKDAETSAEDLLHEVGIVLGLAEDEPPRKVLVVDDRKDNRDLLRELLEAWGFEVKEGKDGIEALEAWDSWKPDAVWMDLRMPRMDGREAVKDIRSCEAERGLPRTPIFALSASVLETDRASVLETGFDEFIFKPFQEAQIAGALEKYAGMRFRRVVAEQGEGAILEVEAMMLLPETWKEAFRTALRIGDSEEAIRLLGELDDQALARKIEPLVQGYRFEELLTLIRMGTANEASS